MRFVLAVLPTLLLVAISAQATSNKSDRVKVEGASSCTDMPIQSIARCPAGKHLEAWQVSLDDLRYNGVGLDTIQGGDSALPNGHAATAKAMPGWHRCLHVEVTCAPSPAVKAPIDMGGGR